MSYRGDKNYREGEEGRQAFVAYLERSGQKVDAPAQTKSPTFEERGKHADKGDINIWTEHGWRRIEVKRSMYWDGKRDPYWPFPDAIIGKPYRLLQPVPGTYPLLAVVILDRDMHRILSIPETSREHWRATSGVSTATGQDKNKDVAVVIDAEHISKRWHRSI